MCGRHMSAESLRGTRLGHRRHWRDGRGDARRAARARPHRRRATSSARIRARSAARPWSRPTTSDVRRAQHRGDQRHRRRCCSGSSRRCSAASWRSCGGRCAPISSSSASSRGRVPRRSARVSITPLWCARMPNTPAQIGRGVTVWFATERSTSWAKHGRAPCWPRSGASSRCTTSVRWRWRPPSAAPDPTYIFLFIEALTDAAVHLGFPRHVARELVLDTMQGSAEFALQSGKHVAQLRDMVTSPGGTSAEALYQLERGGLRTVVSDAVWAAFERTLQLEATLENRRGANAAGTARARGGRTSRPERGGVCTSRVWDRILPCTMPSTHLIGMLLGVEEDWPAAFEALLGRADLAVREGGETHRFTTERMTIEPFDLRMRPRQSLVIDRLGWWYPMPREWLKKVTLMDRVHLLNNPFTFQAMEKHAAYCAMIRLGLKVPETWMLPNKTPPDNPRFAGNRAALSALFRPRGGGRAVGMPLVHEAVRRRRVGRGFAHRERGDAVPRLRRVRAAAHAPAGVSGRLRRLRAQPRHRRRGRSSSISTRRSPMHERYSVDHSFLDAARRATRCSPSCAPSTPSSDGSSTAARR